MGPNDPRTIAHHFCRPSAQKSLVSRVPKISVNAPVASTKMPKGVHFRGAGGSWSRPLGLWPRESVRHFFPPTGVALVDLRLGVHGDLQRLGVALILGAAGGH